MFIAETLKIQYTKYLALYKGHQNEDEAIRSRMIKILFAQVKKDRKEGTYGDDSIVKRNQVFWTNFCERIKKPGWIPYFNKFLLRHPKLKKYVNNNNK